MTMKRLLLLCAGLLVLASCSHQPPPVFYVTDVIPAGCRLEYYAQIYDDSWERTLTQDTIPRPMHVKEAEKWALSAAQQRLGGHWKDYCIRVIPPGRSGAPIVVWQRQTHPINPID